MSTLELTRRPARRHGARAATVVATTLLSLLGSGSQALAATCNAPAGLASAVPERVASASTASGSETTEVFGGGNYRVSRCDARGRFLEGMTVGPISDATGRVMPAPLTISTPTRTTSMLYAGAADPSAAGLPDPIVLPPTNGVDTGMPATADLAITTATATAGTAPTRAASSNDSCTNGRYALFPGPLRWGPRTYNYKINLATFGNNNNTGLSIVRGHRMWDLTTNDCGLGDLNNITSTWTVTGARASQRADGTSAVDKGEVYDLGCGSGPHDPRVIACTVGFRAGGNMVETDQRYDDDVKFTNSGASDAYDYWAVATHETGHSLGLDHVGSSRYLTMHPEMMPGDVHQRTLARGDILGLRALYPHAG